MARCVSSVTPSILTDWENKAFEVPTVRESGMGKDMDLLWEDTIFASVLSSVSFILLLDINWSLNMSLIYEAWYMSLIGSIDICLFIYL